MALRRYTKPVDGSIPVQALLYDDEELLTSQDGVGIYDGSQKAPDYQNGTVNVTSHRLFYIDAQREESRSFALDLSHITQTEYYAGLFKSSAKITCHLAALQIADSSGSEQATTFESWECEVCAYQNPPGLSPAAAKVCGLCGVPRTAVSSPIPHISSSLPSSGVSSPLPPSSQTGRRDSVACPVCTFLNHPSLRECEICGSELPKQLKSAPSSRPMTPDPDDDNDSAARSIKLSFRKGGDKPLYTVLKVSLKTKAWESKAPQAEQPRNTGTPGISGILRSVESSTQGRETDMKDALQDLEALMTKARDMVKLAAELNERLSAAQAANSSSPSPSLATLSAPSASEPEEATFIRSSLSQLGLQMSNAPVTLDMAKDERKWFDDLAKELGRVLQGMMKTSGKGIIALDEVWGGWNRARGVALIPPSTFLQVIPLLPRHTEPPIRHRAFASGLQVLHTPPYTHASFAARTSSSLTLQGPKTTIEIADEEGITIALAEEMIDAVEIDGGIVRDDARSKIQGGGVGVGGVEVKWCSNIFVGYAWDGQD